MRLRSAVSLDDFFDTDEEDELAGWRERETRKGRRRRRRRDKVTRRSPEVRPYPPRRAPARTRQPEPEPVEDEWSDEEDGEEEDELLDLFDAALEELAGRRRRRRFGDDEGSWSRAVRLSRNLRVQAARGYRAAVMELRPGLYLVGEVPEAVARAQFGLAPLLAPLMLRTAARVLHRDRYDDDDDERRGLFRRREHAALPGPSAPQLPGPAHANDGLGWADPIDVTEVVSRGRRG